MQRLLPHPDIDGDGDGRHRRAPQEEAGADQQPGVQFNRIIENLFENLFEILLLESIFQSDFQALKSQKDF